MSLINQMLRDLDARRPESGADSRLPSQVRPLPKAPRSRLRFVVWAIALVVAGSAVAHFGILADTSPPQAALASIAALIPGVSAPPLASSPPARPLTTAPAAAGVAVVTAETPAMAPDDPPPPAPAAGEPGASLRLTDSLSFSGDLAGDARGRAKSEGAVAGGARRPPAPPAAKAASEPAPISAAPPGETDAGREAGADDKPSAAAVAPARSAAAPRIEKTEAITTPAERAESAYRKAIVVLNEGRVGEALDGLRGVLRVDAQHGGARQLLAKLLLEAGRVDDAIEALHEGLQAQPAQLGWAMNVARLQVERRDLGGAWRTLEHSLPAATRNAEYQGFAAHLLHRLGRHREAADGYRRAAQIAPTDGRWWLGLGLALESDKRPAEAREAFLRAQATGTLGGELASLAEQKLR